jgi:tRNA1Val (adenine37-N6)-methyltransferase
MKVGTDSVILGAWADTSDSKNALDVGTGTGILALMLAQKGVDKICAVEIDEVAASQAEKNFNESNYASKINVITQSFQLFSKSMSEKFDLIISNPPYFNNSKKPQNEERKTARHQDLLNFEDLLIGVERIINKDKGIFYLVMPIENLEKFIITSIKYGLYLSDLLLIFPSANHLKPKRAAVKMSTKKNKIKTQYLFIENSERHHYTTQYIELTKDFYLKF